MNPREGLKCYQHQNLGSLVHSRLMSNPSSQFLSSFDSNMHDYMVSRLKTRGLIDLSMGGCSFALKFAPDSHSSGGFVPDKQYCLVTLRMSTQIWEMSGLYTHRKRREMNGAKLLTQFEGNSDVVSGCAWLPSIHQETFELERSHSAKAMLSAMKEQDRARAQVLDGLENGGSDDSFEEDSQDDDWKYEVKMPPFFTSAFDKQIRFYKSGKCAAILTDHNEWVRSMSVDREGKSMVSGCVESNIYGWDITTLKPVWKIVPAHLAPEDFIRSLEGFNSINGLEWSPSSPNIFASGAGDGRVKIWDTRLLRACSRHDDSVITIHAHDGKLNNIQWFKDERFMMTSGRDDVIRMLDMRTATDFIDNSCHNSQKISLDRDKCVIKEFKGHQCSGYNIQATLWDHERRIASGSSNGCVYIYHVESGKLENVLNGPIQPMHLVAELPETCGFGLLTGTAVQPTLFAWGPHSSAENTPFADLDAKRDPNSDESILGLARREAVETLVQRFGAHIVSRIPPESLLTHLIRRTFITVIQDRLARAGRPELLRRIFVDEEDALAELEEANTSLQIQHSHLHQPPH